METNTTAENTATEGIVLVQIDPTIAVLGVNVRSEATLTADFVASIRELGVLEPVDGDGDPQGQFVVLRGQRRTLAAVETKQATIPAVVVPRPEDADRIVQQMAENDHRSDMTTADRVAGVKQLAADWTARQGLGFACLKGVLGPRMKVPLALDLEAALSSRPERRRQPNEKGPMSPHVSTLATLV